MKRTLILMGAFVLWMGLPDARGQSAPSIGPSTLNATGGTKIIGTSEFDWSVGEMAMVSTFYSSKIIVTQGLLQNELSTPQKVANTDLVQRLQVFPNPSSSIVTLQYTAGSDGAFNYRLMDMTGKVLLVHSGAVKEGMTTEQLNIAPLAAATYMLEVSFKSNNDGAEASTSYKIEKLN